jgi:hypothetical protein
VLGGMLLYALVFFRLASREKATEILDVEGARPR